MSQPNMTRRQRAFVAAVGSLLEEQIRPELPALGRWRITLICRIPGAPDSDLMVTGDDLDELAAFIDRARGRKEIPGAVTLPTGGLRT